MAEIRTVDLPLLDVYAQHRISRRELAMSNLSVHTHLDYALDDLVITLKGYFASQQEVFEVKYPRDWWEALKERFAPRWFRKTSPVIYKTFRVDARKVFPEYVLPQLGKSISFINRVEEDPLCDD